MSKDVLIVNLIACLLIGFIVWCMVNSTRSNASTNFGGSPAVKVVINDAGYQPSFIQAKAGQPIILHFVREAQKACASQLIFPQINHVYQVPLKREVAVILPAQTKGELDFRCEDGSRYHGKVVIV